MYQPSWVDLVIVALLIVGITRGRKRGISEELLDLLKWILVLVAGMFLYEPLGTFIFPYMPASQGTCYVFAYLFIATVLLITFSCIKRSVGTKLVESDSFGSAEYYLGMVAGFFRYALIILVFLSVMNAREYTEAEIKATQKYHLDNYGSVFFAGYEVQAEIFQRSLLGSMAKQHLQMVMIRPTASSPKNLKDYRTGVRARERTMEEILK